MAMTNTEVCLLQKQFYTLAIQQKFTFILRKIQRILYMVLQRAKEVFIEITKIHGIFPN